MRASRLLTAVVGIVVAGAMTTGAMTTSGAATAATGTAPPGATKATYGTASRVVHLPTGETVELQDDLKGHPHLVVLPADRTPMTYRAARYGTHQYVVPRSAAPYVGRLIDLALFDVATLPAASAGARIPVRLTYTSASAPSVPGVTITSSTTGAATGYLTAASARTFGAALAAKYTADAKAHFASSSTIFGVTGLRALTSSPIIRPQFPMRTLIIDVKDKTGAAAPPDLVIVSNLDAGGRYVTATFTGGGQGRVSVPVGNYAVDGFVGEVDATGVPTTFSLVGRQDYLVATQNQTVTLDARLATARLSATTPLPAQLNDAAFEVDHTTADGLGVTSVSLLSFGDLAITVQPQPPAAVGTTNSSAAFQLGGGQGSTLPYSYSLSYPGTPNGGVAANQSYAAKAADLGASDHQFFVDRPGLVGSFLQVPLFPDRGSVGFGGPVDLPGRVRSFVSLGSGVVVLSELFALSGNDFTVPPYLIRDGLRLLAAGTIPAYDWGRGPFLSNVPTSTDGEAPFGGSFCYACRTATGMVLLLAPATDSTPGHSVATYLDPTGATVARMRLYRDGAVIFDQTDTAVAQVDLAATTTPSTFRLLDEVNRVPSGGTLSTSTVTDVSFVSASGAGSAMPSGWTCLFTDPCTVPTILQAMVALPVNGVGSVPVGTSTISLALGHVEGAANPAITSGKVEIRRPGGAWTPLPATSTAAGRYSATLTTTAADVGILIDLRVSGTDGVGGSLTQTAGAAFGVGS
jgi:hypothetical protein